MKNLLIIMLLVISGKVCEAQITDLAISDISIVPGAISIGNSGYMDIAMYNVGAVIPVKGVLLNVTVSDHLKIGEMSLMDDYGVWEIIYSSHQPGSTTMYIQNTKGKVAREAKYQIRVKFEVAKESCTDCVAIVGNLGLDDAAERISETEPSNNGKVSYFTAHGSLPITLGRFSAAINDCSDVNIDWETKGENDVERIEVERSYDGISFLSTKAIKAKGKRKVSSTYAVMDETAIQRGKVYYRLKTVDNKGAIAYSKVLDVNVDCDQKPEMRVYPNPAYGHTTVTFKGIRNMPGIEVALLNDQGNIVRTLKMDPSGANVVNLEALPSGAYFIKVLDDKIDLKSKFIKVD